MRNYKTLVGVALFMAIGIPFVLVHPAFAADADIVRTQNFIKSAILGLSLLAGVTAAGFIAVSGFIYITSSGDPERLDKAKSTIKHSAIGLVLVIAAFVISNIVADIATNAFTK